MRLVEQYGDAELQLIYSYLERVTEVSRRELAKMIAANRSSSAKHIPPAN